MLCGCDAGFEFFAVFGGEVVVFGWNVTRLIRWTGLIPLKRDRRGVVELGGRESKRMEWVEKVRNGGEMGVFGGKLGGNGG